MFLNLVINYCQFEYINTICKTFFFFHFVERFYRNDVEITGATLGCLLFSQLLYNFGHDCRKLCKEAINILERFSKKVLFYD